MRSILASLWDGGDWVPASLLVKAGVRILPPSPALPHAIALPGDVTKVVKAFEAAGIMTAKNEGRLWERTWRRRLGHHYQFHATLFSDGVQAQLRSYSDGIRALYSGTPKKTAREWATAAEIAAMRIDGLPLDPKEIGEMLGRHLDRASEGWAWRKRVSRPVTPMTVEYNMFLYVRGVVESLERRGRPRKWP